MDAILRVLKSVGMAVIMFVSVMYLTGNAGLALLMALVPLVISLMGVMVTPVYYLVAAVFLAAVVWAVVPTSIKDFGRESIGKAAEGVKSEWSKNNP